MKTFSLSNTYVAISLLMAIYILGVLGCSKAPDLCAKEYCINGGSCNSNGRCSCPPNYSGEHCDSCSTGYEGINCSLQSRGKFLGSSYAVSETDGVNGHYNYLSQILASYTQIDQVYLLKVANSLFLNTVSATCRGNVITIPRQRPDPDGIYIQGSGIISGDTIIMTYTIIDSVSNMGPTYYSTWVK